MQKNKGLKKNKTSSWQPVQKWYSDLVGEQGSYYHQHVVVPGVLKMINKYHFTSVLDLACGQGIMGRYIDKNIEYVGIDSAKSLIDFAQKHDPSSKHIYEVGDATKDLELKRTSFDLVLCILALQNVDEPGLLIKNAVRHLVAGGKFVIVINHPCFRIPRQSSWIVDEKQNIQYRRVARYLSEMKIPIAAHPGRGAKSPVTWSNHFPLEILSKYIEESGFVIEKIEEWKSDKKSQGGAASRENRSREEIPLFMAIMLRKQNAI